MEQLLYLYALPYDERYPVVCFDERPCFLIGERVEGIALTITHIQGRYFHKVRTLRRAVASHATQ
jgi:hypothetical protein